MIKKWGVDIERQYVSSGVQKNLKGPEGSRGVPARPSGQGYARHKVEVWEAKGSKIMIVLKMRRR